MLCDTAPPDCTFPIKWQIELTTKTEELVSEYEERLLLKSNPVMHSGGVWKEARYFTRLYQMGDIDIQSKYINFNADRLVVNNGYLFSPFEKTHIRRIMSFMRTKIFDIETFDGDTHAGDYFGGLKLIPITNDADHSLILLANIAIAVAGMVTYLGKSRPCVIVISNIFVNDKCKYSTDTIMDYLEAVVNEYPNIQFIISYETNYANKLLKMAQVSE
jgi:hypothetical protein